MSRRSAIMLIGSAAVLVGTVTVWNIQHARHNRSEAERRCERRLHALSIEEVRYCNEVLDVQSRRFNETCCICPDEEDGQ